TLTVLACPSQGKSAAWHGLWLSFRSPGMRALRRLRRNKDVIALGERQAHVQFIGSLEVRDTTDARMTWGTHVDGELPIGRMETRARNPPPAGNRVIFRPGLGQTCGDVETHKALARVDEIFQAVLFGRRQGQVTKIREIFPARIEHQRIVS